MKDRKAYFREYSKANRAHRREYQRAWRAANREHWNAYQRTWSAKRNGTQPGKARPIVERPKPLVPRDGTLSERFLAYRKALAAYK